MEYIRNEFVLIGIIHHNLGKLSVDDYAKMFLVEKHSSIEYKPNPPKNNCFF